MKEDIHQPRGMAGMLLGTLFGFIVLLSFFSACLPQIGLSDAFSSVCHQQADRSHFFEGHPFGLCIRCFWLYAGLTLGCLRQGFLSRMVQPSKCLLISVLLLSGASWLGGWFSSSMDWPLARIVSSLGVGMVVSPYMVSGMAELLATSSSTRKQKLHHEPKRT